MMCIPSVGFVLGDDRIVNAKRLLHCQFSRGLLPQQNINENKHTHPFNGSLSGTARVSQYQKGKTNLNFSEARDSEWQWHQLGHMQVCTSLQTDNHASTPPLSFLQARCPSCRPTNSVKALKAHVSVMSAKPRASSQQLLVTVVMVMKMN